MSLGGELGRTDVGHPDLDRAKSLGSQSSPVGTDPGSYGRRFCLSGHDPTLHVTTQGGDVESGQFDSCQLSSDQTRLTSINV